MLSTQQWISCTEWPEAQPVWLSRCPHYSNELPVHSSHMRPQQPTDLDGTPHSPNSSTLESLTHKLTWLASMPKGSFYSNVTSYAKPKFDGVQKRSAQ